MPITPTCHEHHLPHHHHTHSLPSHPTRASTLPFHSPKTFSVHNNQKKYPQKIKKLFNDSPNEEQFSSQDKMSIQREQGQKRIWSIDEEMRLSQLFRQQGARWRAIGSYYPNHSFWEVKRHFWSLLSRALNHYQIAQFDKKYIRHMLRQIYKNKEAKADQFALHFQEKISQLLTAYLEVTKIDSSQKVKNKVKNLRKVISSFKKTHNRKNSCRSTGTQNLQDQPKRKDSGYQSDFSSAFGSEKQKNVRRFQLMKVEHKFMDEEEVNEPVSGPSKPLVEIANNCEAIKNMLSQVGLLLYQQESDANKDVALSESNEIDMGDYSYGMVSPFELQLDFNQNIDQ